MNIFLSYPSARRDTAVRLKLALEAEHHEVFFDRDDLGAGQAYHQAIRDALQAADLFIFLVSPDSVKPGSYTLAELGQAEARWRRPAGHVLPVVVAATPMADIPPYLLAVTLLEPRGEPVAETLQAVARLAGRRRMGPVRWAAVAAVLLALGLGAAYFERHNRARQEASAQQAQQAQQAQLSQEAQRAASLCRDGAAADGFARLTELTALAAAPPAVRMALEDCAMVGLRQASAVQGGRSFGEITAAPRAVLVQALAAGATGQRAADLRAHLGWADALLRFDPLSPPADPRPHYRQALRDDAGNVYAHAMWGHWLLLGPSAGLDEALGHFEQAVRDGRDLPFVRGLQLGAMLGSDERGTQALRVLAQMRLNNEALPARSRPRIWSYLYASVYRDDTRARRLLQALPPQEGLKTFLWLFPEGGPDPSQQPLWRTTHGLLLAHAGRAAQARPDLLALQQELRAQKASGPLPDAVNRLLAAR